MLFDQLFFTIKKVVICLYVLNTHFVFKLLLSATLGPGESFVGKEDFQL